LEWISARKILNAGSIVCGPSRLCARNAWP